MKRIRILLFIPFLFACSSETIRLIENENLNSTSASENEGVSTFILDEISFTQGSELTVTSFEEVQLFLNAQFTNGKTYRGIRSRFKNTLYDYNESVVWYSNDNSIVTVSSSGKVLGVNPGSTHILASLENKTAVLSITITDRYESSVETPTEESVVDEEPDDEPEETNSITTEEAYDESDYFLNENDTISLDIADDGGYGYDNFPYILYGPPVDVYDVLSLGTSGSITIELNGYIVANGEGDDFTVFENPFTGWQECGEVSVSEDGNTYHSFTCDQYNADGNFSGCAGAVEVVYGLDDDDYRDPTLSGGDSFDIDDLGLSYVKYIKIVDIGLCYADASKSLYLTSSAPNGFDLDALAIINGIND